MRVSDCSRLCDLDPMKACSTIIIDIPAIMDENRRIMIIVTMELSANSALSFRQSLSSMCKHMRGWPKCLRTIDVNPSIVGTQSIVLTEHHSSREFLQDFLTILRHFLPILVVQQVLLEAIVSLPDLVE